MELRRSPRRRTRENIVPLVNIVFLLLIFFMLTGTLRGPEAFPIEAPETTHGLPPGEAGRTLLLDRAGRLAVDGRIVAPEDLREVLGAWSASESRPNPQEEPLRELVRAPATGPNAAPEMRPPIRLRADRRARADQLLPLLETLSELGFDNVALVTRDAG